MTKFNMHSKSLCELPKWTFDKDFDSFHAGAVGGPLAGAIPKAFLEEEVSERVRFFAEVRDK